jgi:hypothetical protein
METRGWISSFQIAILAEDKQATHIARNRALLMNKQAEAG